MVELRMEAILPSELPDIIETYEEKYGIEL